MLSLGIKLDSPSLKKVYFQIRSFKKIQNLTKKVRTQNVALIKTKLLTYFEPISTSIPHENMRKRPVFGCFRGYRSGTLVENGLRNKLQ